MPGFLLHQNAMVQCIHFGSATPTFVSPFVRVGGMAVTMQPYPYTIAGCGLTGNAPPCVTATWLTAATKVFASAAPVLLFDSQAQCAAPGTGVLITGTQTRVTGT